MDKELFMKFNRGRERFTTRESVVALIAASIISQEDLLKCIGAIGLNTTAAVARTASPVPIFPYIGHTQSGARFDFCMPLPEPGSLVFRMGG